MKTKLVAVVAAVAAFVTGPVGGTTAQAQPPCDRLSEPAEFACVSALETYWFVSNEANEAYGFVSNEANQAYWFVSGYAADTVFGVACTVFPTRPECQ